MVPVSDQLVVFWRKELDGAIWRKDVNDPITELSFKLLPVYCETAVRGRKRRVVTRRRECWTQLCNNGQPVAQVKEQQIFAMADRLS